MQPLISKLNGVDPGRFSENIDTLTTQPGLAKFKFGLCNQWVDGGYNQSLIKDYYGVSKVHTSRDAAFIPTSDEPMFLLGKDNAPNPFEYLLHVLAGCMTTSVVYHAAARGFEIKKVQTSIEGDIDVKRFLDIKTQVRNGFEGMRVSIDIEGNLSEGDKEEILRFSEYSPILDIISNPVPVKINLNVFQNDTPIDC